MKFTHIIFSIFFIIALISCEEPVHEEYNLDGTIHNNDDTTAIFRASVDGNVFEADRKEATIVNGIMNITGIGTNGELITITINSDQEGNYNLDYDASAAIITGGLAYKAEENATDAYAAGNVVENTSLQVSVNSIDNTNKLISGTFSAMPHNGTGESINITDGVFTNVHFETELSNNNANEFFAKIDGNEFMEDSIQAIEATVSGYTSIGITATKNSFETIGLNIPITAASIGTHDFSSVPTQGAFTAQYNVSQTEFYTAGSGSLTITAHDTTAKTMEGTFFFTAQPMTGGTPTFEITEGSFKVSY